MPRVRDAVVTEARRVPGTSATGGKPYHVVTITCPLCGREHRHGWGGGGNRLPECGRGPAYRLTWPDSLGPEPSQ